MIFPQQLNAARQIIDEFDNTNYAVLLAQMQSGKTGTFMLVLCEMIRLGKVEFGVVFSGNRETDLKEQTKQQDDFFKDYEQFLLSIGVTDIGIATIIKDTKFQVVWGPDLKHFSPKGKTVYIWEESHYGQSSKQEVDKFIQKVGIDATGLTPKDGSFVLSVSATPFSEFVDNIRLKQNKHIVRLFPPQQYLSVKQMLESGQLSFYKIDPRIQFDLCLKKPYAPGYAIVRGMASILEPIARKNGWDTIHYDLKTKDTINLDEVMTTQPVRPTIIFIKGMLRMGKQLKKNFVRFVFESSRSTKTDSILQGLLGRCCGYDSRPDIAVYVRQNTIVKRVPIMNKDGIVVKRRIEGKTPRLVPCSALIEVNVTEQEIKRFIALHDGTESSPLGGTNMMVHHAIEPQVPIQISFTADEWESFYGPMSSDLEPRTKMRLNAWKDVEKFKDVVTALKKELLPPNKEFSIIHLRNWWAENVLAKDGLYSDLDNAVTNQKPYYPTGKGIGISVGELTIFPDPYKQCLYVTFVKEATLGVTTGREVFRNKSNYESADEVVLDGYFPIRIPATIGTDRDVFADVLGECVSIWRLAQYVEVPNSISSKKPGIILNDDIFAQIQPGGDIFNMFKLRGITISYKKLAGRVPDALAGVRLRQISWKESRIDLPVAIPLSLDEPEPDYIIEGIIKGTAC
jgi:hypothetical protein